MLNVYYYDSKKIKCKLLVVETVKTGQGTSWLLRVSSANETKNKCNDFNVCIKETIRRRRIYILRFWETLSTGVLMYFRVVHSCFTTTIILKLKCIKTYRLKRYIDYGTGKE